MEYWLDSNQLYQFCGFVSFENLDNLEEHGFILVVIYFIDNEVMELWLAWWFSALLVLHFQNFFNDDLVQMSPAFFFVI